MSEQIDWSKAPEGATHYVFGWGFFKLDLAGWFICDDDEKVWRKTPYQSPDNFSWWGRAVERPSPDWSGEGLPPVGVVCGKCYNSPGEYYNVKVLAHDSHYGEVVIYRWIEGPLEGELDESTMHLNMASGSNAHWSFRPVRTPEQFAADERERFAQELVAAMGKGGGPNALYQARRMYDLGYRKP